jgi:glycosyltransferase involved in cell wall biosynthesis
MKKTNSKKLKIALVHEYLVKIGGGERVLKALSDLYPDADIFSIVYDPKMVKKILGKNKKIHSTFLQKFPNAIKKYQNYLWMMSKAVESWDFSKYDVVITDSHSFGKGIITGPKTFHVNYCYTPTRYLWLNSEEHIERSKYFKPLKKIIPIILKRLKVWDLKAAKRPDKFVAICKNIQNKIKKYYNRSSEIIFPPIDWQFWRPTKKRADFYLYISRLEPHKKPDLAVKAFNNLGLKLKVVGVGTLEKSLKKIASDNIEFLGEVTDTELRDLYSSALAVIFPQDEDFGLVPLEAAACGTPSIAYKKGGALETIIDKKTGEFFDKPTLESLAKVVKKFNANAYDSKTLRNHARKFSIQEFQKNFKKYIKKI